MVLTANIDDLSEDSADDGFLFVDEVAPDDRDTRGEVSNAPWKILITDDDDEVHRATAFSLRGVTIDGRPLELLHAYSGIEAEALLRKTTDVAVALLDVVMETPDAGLRLVDTIRNTLGQMTMRIVLRTGQAGYAPELEVIRRYDINDYRTKSELTQTRLVTTLTAAARAYEQLELVARINRGLDTLVAATNSVFRLRTTQEFAQATLEKLGELLDVPVHGVVCADRLVGQESSEPALMVVCGLGRYASATGVAVHTGLSVQIQHSIARCLGAKTSVFESSLFLMWLGSTSRDAVVLLEVPRALSESDRRLVGMFAANLSVGFENVDLIERLDFFAFFDPLTHLPNRTRFISDVDQDMFSRHGAARSLAIADVVRFSDVNDALGHRCGDSLLVAVSKRLRGALGPSVKISRISGDAFGLYGDERAIDPTLIRQAFEAPFFIHGHALSIQLRLGLVRVSEGKGNATDLLRDANLALNQARKAGGAAYSVYSLSLSDDAHSRVSMLHALRAAIDFKRGLSVHYQPVINARTGALLGAEALLRWRNDSGEMISPERFIPLAESTGMINELGLWVIETALDRLAIWHGQGYADLKMSINLSPVELRSEDFSERIRGLIEYADVPPRLVILELTESIGLEDSAIVRQHLRDFLRDGAQDCHRRFRNRLFIAEAIVQLARSDREDRSCICEHAG